MEHHVYVAFGSNLDERKETILSAMEEMKRKKMEFLRISTMYETEPYGVADQPKFMNCVAFVKTELAPMELMETLLDIEKDLGRVRDQRWGPRKIDLDIIFYDKKIINFVDLMIPHPDMQNRDFVLKPLAEIAPDYFHPMLKKTVSELLSDLEGAKM